MQKPLIIFDSCPVPVYVCPEGSTVVTGHSFSQAFEKEHPLRIAYEMWCGGRGQGTFFLGSYYSFICVRAAKLAFQS